MRRVNIIGEIGWQAFSDFTSSLDEFEGASTSPIRVTLASDGGDAKAALAFSSRIRLSPCDIIITACGNVASAAVLILASGDRRSMTKEAWVMVHEENTGESVNDLPLADAEREIKQLRRVEDQWNGLLEDYTKTDWTVWEKLHKQTTYLDADECLKLGLVDEVI